MRTPIRMFCLNSAQMAEYDCHFSRWCFGVGSNWLYLVKHAAIDGTIHIRRKHSGALCKHIYV